jgi:hypothetical protein
VPDAPAEPAAIPGTEGVTLPPAPTVEQAAQREALAQELSQTGWSPGLCALAAGA